MEEILIKSIESLLSKSKAKKLAEASAIEKQGETELIELFFAQKELLEQMEQTKEILQENLQKLSFASQALHSLFVFVDRINGLRKKK